MLSNSPIIRLLLTIFKRIQSSLHVLTNGQVFIALLVSVALDGGVFQHTAGTANTRGDPDDVPLLCTKIQTQPGAMLLVIDAGNVSANLVIFLELQDTHKIHLQEMFRLRHAMRHPAASVRVYFAAKPQTSVCC